jgi:hypothetical protein
MSPRESATMRRTVTGSFVMDEIKGGGIKVFRAFRCLPDTIDPRGPKGGGR